MRNAVAHLDDDFAFDEPARKPKPASKSRGPKKRAAARPKREKRRYAHYVAVALSASLAIGIMVNALVMQHSRHPAPLFGEAIQLGAQPAPLVATAPPPAAAIVEQTASLPPTKAPVPPVSPPTPTSVQRPHHAAVETAPVAKATPAPKAKPDDAIAKLLLKTSAAPATSEKAKESSKTVLAAQHALMKLGFVVKPTGTFGPTTHAALEAFERDQHMPVKGEMSRKLLKQLSAESGVAID